MKPSESDLSDLVLRIVGSIQPLRIILFGSAARGEMGQHSDLDVLVVVPDGSNCLEAAKAAYRSLRGYPHPKDVLVVQQSDLEQYGNNPYLVIHDALREGKELYRAAS
ncbi:MAG TPA: nucleotidyltransferase domain-containing protein [Planctomycetaceae bacterium]|nr:nucleotidyltransferase domain-containing protein [Planctomycetaceae bacterium]